MHLFPLANIVTTSKALVTSSDALVPSSEHWSAERHRVVEVLRWFGLHSKPLARAPAELGTFLQPPRS